MSAEFEKIVIEKLNKIEATLDVHSKTFDKIEARFKKQDERFAEQDARFAEQDKKFAKQDERFAKQDERFEKQDDRMDRIEKLAIENSKKIDSILETLKIHSNILIKLEYDLDKKFKTVLDGISAITDKTTMHDDMFMHMNSKLLNHDIRLLALEEEQEKYSK